MPAQASVHHSGQRSGLGAGAGTEAIGITTGPSGISASLRRCRIQGFKYGVVMHGPNHQIESNRFELNTFVGIYTRGGYHVIRGNEVLATGGRPGSESPWGINAYGVATVVAGNTVDGSVRWKTLRPRACRAGSSLPVSSRTTPSAGLVRGITTMGPTMVRGNTLVQAEPTNGLGIHGNGVCRDNSIFDFSTGIFGATCSPVVANYAFGAF